MGILSGDVVLFFKWQVAEIDEGGEGEGEGEGVEGGGGEGEGV